MSRAPKNEHKLLLYRLERARRFACTTSEAESRLYHEVSAAVESLAAPKEGEDRRDALQRMLHASLVQWRSGLLKFGTFPPRELERLRDIVGASQPPKRRRRR